MSGTASPRRKDSGYSHRRMPSPLPSLLPNSMTDALTPPSSARDFHDRIYRGDIVEIAGNAAMTELVAHARGLVEEALRPHDPQRLHEHLTPAQQIDTLTALQRAFTASADTRRIWRALLASLGLDPARIACDRLHLRFQPHRAPGSVCARHDSTATVAFHRDTWGSNLYAQTNWWAPIYPVSAGRTMALYPALWSRPLKNSSAAFDMRALLERSAAGGRTAVGADEAIPHLQEAVDAAEAQPVLVPPGTLIAFSGAHAHTGVGNHTGLTRISFETRTVWLDDLLAGRGAPNIDGQAPWAAPGLFRMLDDRRPLNEVLGCARTEACAHWPLATPVGSGGPARR